MNESRDFSGRLTFSFQEIKNKNYAKVNKALVSEFKLREASGITQSLDEIFQDFSLGEVVVSLEWDNWSGYSVVAKSVESEKLARDIALFVRDNYRE